MQALKPDLEVCAVSDDETEETEGEVGKEDAGKVKMTTDNGEEEVEDLTRGEKKVRKRIAIEVR